MFINIHNYFSDNINYEGDMMNDKFDIFNSTLDVCILSKPAKCEYVIGEYDGIRFCGNKEHCQYVKQCKLTEEPTYNSCTIGDKNDTE